MELQQGILLSSLIVSSVAILGIIFVAVCGIVIYDRVSKIESNQKQLEIIVTQLSRKVSASAMLNELFPPEPQSSKNKAKGKVFKIIKDTDEEKE